MPIRCRVSRCETPKQRAPSAEEAIPVSPAVAATPADPAVTAAPDDHPVATAADKLAVPGLPAGLIRRSRLFERLDAGVRGPVTLVAAQAGGGKTVLLASWVAEATRPDR